MNIDDFLKEYSPYDLNFNKVDYRRGARITGHLGLEEGYTVQPDKSIKFDTVRIHTGVDRSGIYGNHGQHIENLVVCPFNFNRSSRIYYGPNTSYGNLIQLFNDDYGFEMRIAHMNPQSDIVPEILKQLNAKSAIKRGDVLGRAGNFGISGGLHTHTEFISIGETCKIFDDLLFKKFGEEVFKEYSQIEVLKMYQNKELWIGKPAKDIFAHYEKIKLDRGIISMSKYKYQYKEAGTNAIRTRYSSEFLFNGL